MPGDELSPPAVSKTCVKAARPCLDPPANRSCPSRTSPSLTCHGCFEAVFLAALLADPLLAAFIAELHPPGVGALGGRQPQVVGAQGDAADGAVHADALQLAGGLEALPVVVDLAQQVARRTLVSWRKRKRRS